MNKYVERLYNGIIKENPTFVLMLGMCPTLAVTSSAINGLGMGLSTTVVLVFANLLISLFRKVIPNGVRMPAFIVIVASLVTVVQFVLEGYVPVLSAALGVYIPLIVVNCIILGRAESYASKNGPIESIFDGIGMGLGFTMGLTLIGLVREFLGAGTAFNVQILGDWFTPITIFIMAPGAFLVLSFLVAGMNIIRGKMEASAKAAEAPAADPTGCFAPGYVRPEAPKPAPKPAAKPAAKAADGAAPAKPKFTPEEIEEMKKAAAAKKAAAEAAKAAAAKAEENK